jgi:5'-nucleotidase (lipoprotein e(P4) family)
MLMRSLPRITLTIIRVAGVVGCSTVQRDDAFGILYAARAAENRELAYQAFNVARRQLDAALAKRSGRQLAVVVDIDETILDNSPVQAQAALQGESYSRARFETWAKRAAARPIPGAVDFLRYADRRGVAVFYITNRWETDEDGQLTGNAKAPLPICARPDSR